MQLYNLIIKKIIFFCLLLLTACYKQTSIKKYINFNYDNCYHDCYNDVNLTIKKLNSEETKNFFRINLYSKGYIPLNIKIENQSCNTYLVRPSYISLNTVNPNAIAKILHYDTSFWVTTGSILSLLFWWPATIFVAQKGFNMRKANLESDSFINDLSIYHEEVIRLFPYETLNKFIFIESEDYLPCFEFKMFNETEKKLLVFDVNLRL